MLRTIRKLDKVAFQLAVIIITCAIIGYAYSWVEGYIDPVMSPLEITDVRRGPSEFDVTFNGTAQKIRPCDWVESRWYIGERFERSVRTKWNFSGPPQIREEGLLVWLDQVAQMTPQELYHNSHADVVHSCPWRLWNVVTPFYDSNDDIPIPELGEPVVNQLKLQIEELRLEVESLK